MEERKRLAVTQTCLRYIAGVVRSGPAGLEGVKFRDKTIFLECPFACVSGKIGRQTGHGAEGSGCHVVAMRERWSWMWGLGILFVFWTRD